MKKIALSFVLLGLILSGVYADAKQDDIRKLMKMSGSAEMGIQVMDALIEQFKNILPDVPEEFWLEFMKEVNPNDIIELIVPIYDKYFSHDEIKALIRFYESPVGKKMVKVQPQITEESMHAGQTWGEELGKRAQQKLIEKGYLDL
ncbi:MAG: DUF2059 domain-containing protein [Spirochaetales bacterium]|nr:DUF2059 domain-containing protein [Spirochaetales bacterium]